MHFLTVSQMIQGSSREQSNFLLSNKKDYHVWESNTTVCVTGEMLKLYKSWRCGFNSWIILFYTNIKFCIPSPPPANSPSVKIQIIGTWRDGATLSWCFALASCPWAHSRQRKYKKVRIITGLVVVFCLNNSCKSSSNFFPYSRHLAQENMSGWFLRDSML